MLGIHSSFLPLEIAAASLLLRRLPLPNSVRMVGIHRVTPSSYAREEAAMMGKMAREEAKRQTALDVG